MKSSITVVVMTLVMATGMTAQAQNLPQDESSEFTGSGNCADCHSSDGTVNTEDGVDISMPTLWRSTMMANAGKDPLWRAKVSAEIAELPQYAGAIQTTCTRCHAPMGNEQAMHDGATSYTLAEMEADPLAMDGVSCTLCHQVEPDNFGLPESYSGNFELDDERLIYGPFTGPLTQPMVVNSGFVPVYTTHMAGSELCATCHTLFTAFLNEDGQLSGSFPEQTPYLEWKNSTFGDTGVECQSCHMPLADTAQDISTMPGWHTTLREPYRKHEFVGANELMLNILKDNSAQLGVTATAAHFDATLARTRDMLENETVGLSATHSLTTDTLAIDLVVENYCGHKLPTGIPLRRMWIHLRVTDGQGQTIFESGSWDEDGEIAGLDPSYEPHHDVINDSDQIQIYQGVMGDVHGEQTYTLLHAAQYLKDNRLPPMGFNSSHTAYDSTAIFGAALEDADFNRSAQGEGRGADTVHYRIPVSTGGPFEVAVAALYQTMTPRFYEDMVSHDTPEVQMFAPMYEAADKTPALLGSLHFEVAEISAVDPDRLPVPLRLNQNVPNPFNPATVISFETKSDQLVSLDIHDVSGRRVKSLVSENLSAGMHRVTWDGTDDQGEAVASGIYLYRLLAGGDQLSRTMSLVR